MEPPQRNLTLHRYKRTNQGFVEDLGNGVTLTLMLIPAGEFMMGSATDDPNGSEDEQPQHLVKVSKFLMGKYPVTQSQWRAVAGLKKVEIDLKAEPSKFKGDNRPVEQVSWHEAVEFCERLSVHTGREYGLPSEAEWEYACRAGTETPYHCGATITAEIANFLSNDPREAYQEGTTPVDHFDVANAFGLYDLHGNVWEWCQDHWHNNYKNAPSDGRAWFNEKESSSYVVRGGAWYLDSESCRSRSRFNFTSTYSFSRLGFRMVCRAT